MQIHITSINIAHSHVYTQNTDKSELQFSVIDWDLDYVIKTFEVLRYGIELNLIFSTRQNWTFAVHRREGMIETSNNDII